MNRKIGLITAVCLMVAPAFAAPPYQRPAGIADDKEPPIVAGYRALFTCSAHFFAGRPLDDIKKVELVDVEGLGYPDPLIDERRKIVTATDISGQIVRIAAFRDTMGCTVLPPQWQLGDISRLPYVQYAAPPDVARVPFPAGDRVELPADGLDGRYRELAPILERAFDGKSYGEGEGVVTTAVIIAKDGKIIAERYRPGFGIYSGYRTWSTSKSISAAVMGIAAKQGLLDLDAPVSIPEWGYPGDPRQAITYKHLLWMSSGLFSGGPNTYSVYFGGQDVVSAVTTTPLEAEPGTRWKYANNDTLLLLRALRYRLADDLRYLRFPYDELLHPIGMYHTRMEIDHLGNFVGSSQTYTTARDLTLDAGADIEAPGAVIGGGTPLSDATAFGQWNAARRLIERGAKSSMWESAALGLMDRLQACFAADPPPGPDDVTHAFWCACHGGQQGAAEYLLARRRHELDRVRRFDALRRGASRGANELVGWLHGQGGRSAKEPC